MSDSHFTPILKSSDDKRKGGPGSISSQSNEKEGGSGTVDHKSFDAAVDRHAERAATFKVDLLIIPLLGLFCSAFILHPL